MVDEDMKRIPSPVIKFSVKNIPRFVISVLWIFNLNRLSINKLQFVDAINQCHVDAAFVVTFIMHYAIIVRFQRCLIKQHVQNILILNLCDA